MEKTGIIIAKVDDRSGQSEHGAWRIASFVLQTTEQYSHKICFDVSDGSMGRIAAFEAMMNKHVTVSFDIDAHEYNGRWFNSIRAYKAVEVTHDNSATRTQPKQDFRPQPTPPPSAATIQPEQPLPEELEIGEKEDLPF